MNGHGIEGLEIRKAQENDCALLMNLIIHLAVYEKLEHEVTATVEQLRSTIFEKEQCEAIIAEYGGKDIGFALFFQNYSTFLGQGNLYLEDLFVLEPFRGLGIGKALLRAVALTGVRRGARRLDWSCLDWNEPAKAFYKSIGANEMQEWRVFRLEGDSLLSFAVDDSDTK